MHQPFVLDHESRNFRVANAPGQFRSDPPMRDYVVSREASGLPCFLKRDLRRENGAWVAQRDQNFCMREPT